MAQHLHYVARVLHLDIENVLWKGMGYLAGTMDFLRYTFIFIRDSVYSRSLSGLPL